MMVEIMDLLLAAYIEDLKFVSSFQCKHVVVFGISCLSECFKAGFKPTNTLINALEKQELVM